MENGKDTKVLESGVETSSQWGMLSGTVPIQKRYGKEYKDSSV